MNDDYVMNDGCAMPAPMVNILEERCTGCGECVKECPKGGFVMDRNFPVAVRLANFEAACVGCRQCQRACPYNCITVSGPFGGLNERTPRRNLPPAERLAGFQEVALGFSQEEAVKEARRCLECPRPRCRDAGCPAGNDIPAMAAAIREGDLLGALRILTRNSNLHTVCSRVCNQTALCEGACVYSREGGQAVAIGQLERFVGDWAREKGYVRVDAGVPPTGYCVAVIGSGPAGLSAAEDLARRGHAVTVYDVMPVAGGVMAWGIPDFVLPHQLVAAKVDELRFLGVQFRLGVRLNRTDGIERLLQAGTDAVFLATGTETEEFLDLPGRNLPGICTATGFLRGNKLASMFPEDFPTLSVGPTVLVIGAGSTGLHAARTARRLGAGPVFAVDPLPEDRSMISPEELAAATDEGVHIRFGIVPTAFLGRSKVEAVEFIRMASRRNLWGKSHLRPLRGSSFTMAADTVVVAIDGMADRDVQAQAAAADLNGCGTLVVRNEKGQTNREKVWAAGDVVGGPGSVVAAMVAGKEAARHIDQTLRWKHLFAHEGGGSPPAQRSPRSERKFPLRLWPDGA